MNKVREDLDRITRERDAVLYYNPDDLNRQIIEEKVEEKVNEIIEERLEEAVEKVRAEGILENQKLAVKNMLDRNYDENLIKELLNINDDILNKIKRTLIF